MANDNRTREELVLELAALRGRLDELERKQDEHDVTVAVLRDSQRVFQLVMDTVPQRLFWKDRNYQFIGCNRVFAQDAGLTSPEEIVGKSDFELSWRESAHLYRADDVAVVEEGMSKVDFEEPQVREDGSVLWLRTTKIPLRNAQGDVIGVYGCYEDITAQKMALEAVKRSEERYRTLFEQASDGILVTDEDGRVTSSNPAARQLLGFSNEQLQELNLRDLIAAEDQAVHPIPWDQIRAGEHIVRERNMKRADGSVVLVEISAKQLPDGRLEGILRDISARLRAEAERRALEDQLRQAQKMESIGRLAGGIAHDFNNLLSVMLGHGHLLSSQLDKADPRHRHANAVISAADRAAALTRQLLAFSRKQVLQPTRLELNAVVAGMEKILQQLLRENVELHLILEPDLPTIEADVTQVEQIIMNLAVNAADAMPDGGELTIETSVAVATTTDTEEPVVALRVRDTGTGMTEEVAAHIFEPFFTTKDVGEGTGLGLATVYGIVMQSHGSIEVASAVGEGTTFAIHFPTAMGAAGEQVERAPESKVSNQTAVILLAEDDDNLRETISLILRDHGHHVVALADGQAALDTFVERGEDFDLLVTDVVMPKLSGVLLAEHVLERRAELPVLLLSGYAAQLGRSGGELDERMTFLPKPFSPATLLDVVSELLARSTADDAAG